MTELETAIVKTLAYADLFDQALTTEELRRYLVEYPVKDSDKLVAQECKSARVQEGLWVLEGREELFDLKASHLETCTLKLVTARRWRWPFRLLPWVKLVAVSGSVAGGSPRSQDDIDMVVVTVKHRLWLSRFILVGVLSLFGKRRKPDDDPNRVSDKLCLNMWLTEDRLKSEDQDVYVAHELVQLVPILNRDDMYERYLAANEWTLKIMPNLKNQESRSKNYGIDSLALLGNDTRFLANLHSSTLDWLDSMVERWQRKQMAQVTKEVVEDDLLMFHPRDYRSEVLERYQKKLKELGM